jgi:methylthioribose-1-phosphate isomerase
MIEPIHWRDDELYIIDQTLLPGVCEEIKLTTAEAVWEAIKALRVRGAPAIGICAAYGLVVGVKEKAPDSSASFRGAVEEVAAYLATSRPTAVNLFWALDRMKACVKGMDDATNVDGLYKGIVVEANIISDEEKGRCRAIGEHGAALVKEGSGVLTHCNAGGLATGAHGTALAVMFKAHDEGRQFTVFADETRPLLQGARLTTWELMQADIETILICDNMAAQVMKEGKIQLVVVGADRIASNGDAANKIGTYQVAVCAQAHNIPFYVAAPLSTFDMNITSGDEIPIELREAEEVTRGFGKQTAPDDVQVYSPAFDVTPANLIAGIITEVGILRPPYVDSILASFAQASPMG